MTLLYPKIYPPYERFKDGPFRGKLDILIWNSDLAALQSLNWTWYEKIDGTNIRVLWDGYRVTLGGRTEKAQIPTILSNYLIEKFPEELMEEKFGKVPAVLYGEGTALGIQSSGNYSHNPMFHLFDVTIKDSEHPCGWWWLREDDVNDIGEFFKTTVAPKLFVSMIAIAYELVKEGLKSTYGDFLAEGVVGKLPYLGRNGHRLMTKLKRKDLVF